MDFIIFKPDENEEPKPDTPADPAESSTTAGKVENIVSFSVESPDLYMSVAEAAEMLWVTEEKVIELIHSLKIYTTQTDVDEDKNELSHQIPKARFYADLKKIQGGLFLEWAQSMQIPKLNLGPEYMSVAEAAAILWVSEKKIIRAIEKSLIPTKLEFEDVDRETVPHQIMRRTFLKNIEDIRQNILHKDSEEEEGHRTSLRIVTDE